jgi:hypothetical protein
MIATLNNPIGLNLAIQKLQEIIYEKLEQSFPDLVHYSYGRCYRNRKASGYVAEYYLGGGEYREAYFDDSADIVSFFGIGGTIRDNTQQRTNVHLVVFANIEAMFPETEHRADEEARAFFMNIFGKALFGFHYDGCDLGIENVLKEYKASIAQLHQCDMHPLHAFRLNFSISFNHNNQSTLKLN